jgi:hypothetical protein
MVVASPVVRVFMRKTLDRVRTWRLSIGQFKGSSPKDSMITIVEKKGE